MLYFIALVLGIITGIMAKGHLYNIMDFKIKKVWLIAPAFLVQILIQFAAGRGFVLEGPYDMVLQLSVLAVLLAGFWFNRRYIGIWLVAAGYISNNIVMAVNGGKMPVSAELAEMLHRAGSQLDGRHVLINEAAKLPFLSDVIHLPYFLGNMLKMASAGDMAVLAGLFVIGVEMVSGRFRQFTNRKKRRVYEIDRVIY